MTNVAILPGSGPPVKSSTLVSADQETILGSGSAEDPLHASLGGASQVAFPAGFGLTTHLGAAVKASGTGGYAAAVADSLADSAVVGLVSKIGGTVAEAAQYAGELTLTTAEWDVATGGSGGLTPDAPYYLDAVTGGKLTTVAPSAGGTYVVLLGVALSATTMLVRLGAAVGPHT